MKKIILSILMLLSVTSIKAMSQDEILHQSSYVVAITMTATALYIESEVNKLLKEKELTHPELSSVRYNQQWSVLCSATTLTCINLKRPIATIITAIAAPCFSLEKYNRLTAHIKELDAKKSAAQK